MLTDFQLVITGVVQFLRVFTTKSTFHADRGEETSPTTATRDFRRGTQGHRAETSEGRSMQRLILLLSVMFITVWLAVIM